MPLPDFREDGWLPEGHHAATWEEIAARFGGTPGSRRAAVHSRLLAWRDALRDRNVGGRVILDGSFISQKVGPGDFDAIFVYDEASVAALARDAEARNLIDINFIKERFRADVFVFSSTAVRDSPAFCRTDGFDRHKITQKPKGVVEVTL